MKPIYCADLIGKYADRYVLVWRIKEGCYAIPGGKQDAGETLSECAVREFKEETGLDAYIKETFGTYAEDGRDPRGRYVSTVFTGHAIGRPQGERGKTQVHLKLRREIEALYPQFWSDHATIFADYFRHIDTPLRTP